MLILAGLYIGSQTAEFHSLTEPDGGIPVALIASVWVAGGLFYLAGVAVEEWTPLAKVLELVGLGLIFLVFALPSSLVLFLPVIAVFAEPAIRQVLARSESERTILGHRG